MGYKVNDLITTCKVLFDEKACLLDANLPVSPFNDQILQQTIQEPSKMKIGVLDESYFLKCSESVKRSMKMTSDVLKNAGYELVPFSFTNEEWDEARKFYIGLLVNGIGPPILDSIVNNNEPLMNHVTPMKLFCEMGSIRRWMME